MTQILCKKMVSAAFFVCLSINAMEPQEDFEVNQFIDEHKNSPEILRDLLIDMGRWETPDLEAAKKILNLGVVSANDKDKGNVWEGYYGNPGAAALTTAASYGKTDYVKLLLDYKADIEIKDPWDSRTAIMAAALHGHNDTLELLLSHGANVNATNCYGTTALIWAASEVKVETVKLLLKAKADVNAKNKDGETALKAAKGTIFWRYRDQCDQIVKLLEDAGAKE